MPSEVVTGVLKLAFSFIRTYGAKKLQDGGLTDQKFRGIIVRELDDINFKLDGLCRKDLSASISQLNKGFKRLNMSFDKSAESENPSTSEIPKDEKESKDLTNLGESSSQTKPAQQSVTMEDAVSIASAIGELKINKERFESAKESFTKAGEKATDAFHNPALSTNERILATEVRIASGILENLDDPSLAATDCLLYLKEMHDMPAIKDMFSVHLKGGLKSLCKRKSRLKIVKSVKSINLILADFISKFTKQRMAVFDWPTIECGKQIVHPVHYERKSVQKTKGMEIKLPWNVVMITTAQVINDFVINSKGDIIGICFNRSLRKLDRETGALMQFCHSNPSVSLNDDTASISSLESSESGDSSPHLKHASLAIDDNDNMYVLSFKRSWENYCTGCFFFIALLLCCRTGHFVTTLSISVYSPDGMTIHHQPLNFLEEDEVRAYGFTLTKDKEIVIYSEGSANHGHGTVYVCAINGRLERCFPICPKSKHETVWGLLVSCDNAGENEIIIATKRLSTDKRLKLYAYTQEGNLKRTLELGKTSCSEHHSIMFDHVTRNYIVCSGNKTKEIYVESFSETGKLQNSPFLDDFMTDDENVIWGSHINGAIALATPECVVHLQSSLNHYCSVGNKIWYNFDIKI